MHRYILIAFVAVCVAGCNSARYARDTASLANRHTRTVASELARLSESRTAIARAREANLSNLATSTSGMLDKLGETAPELRFSEAGEARQTLFDKVKASAEEAGARRAASDQQLAEQAARLKAAKSALAVPKEKLDVVTEALSSLSEKQGIKYQFEFLVKFFSDVDKTMRALEKENAQAAPEAKSE